MRKVLKKFDVEYLQVLDQNGKVDAKLMPKLSNDDIKKFFELMLKARLFDDKTLRLQREGRMGTYASVLGQEAAQVGSAYALSKTDWMFPAFREVASFITRGIPMESILLYWGGDERGNEFLNMKNKTFPFAVPVASQTLYATGVAWASKLKKESSSILVYFGDGATSKGDFLESANFAGVFNLPIVYFCQNNQFAISLGREKQTKAETIAQKAIAFGFKGIQVDGNDVFAVYKATKEALECARKGDGPTLIEAFTYRMQDHTTADDASRYREEKEVEEWKKKDPLDRLRKYMKSKKLWTEKYEKELVKKFNEEVDQAIKNKESKPKQKVDDLFNYVYKDITPNLKEQLDYLKEFENEG